MEEENATEEAHHPHIKDSFDSIPRPPLKRQRTSCALVDLLGATFASTSDNTAPKSEHDVAAAEIKRYRDETPLPLTGNPLSWWKDHEQEYPQLSKVARSFLCIPGTSVSAESFLLCRRHSKCTEKCPESRPCRSACIPAQKSGN